MCGHSGGMKLSWGGVRNFEAVLGGGRNCTSRFLLCIKHLFNHFIHLFLWSRFFSNKIDVLFQLVGN